MISLLAENCVRAKGRKDKRQGRSQAFRYGAEEAEKFVRWVIKKPGLYF